MCQNDSWLDPAVGTGGCDGPDLKRAGPKTVILEYNNIF